MALVEINQLRALQRRMKKLNEDAPNIWKSELKEIAVDVQDEIRDKAKRQPGVTPKAATAVKAFAQQRQAGVKLRRRKNKRRKGGFEFGAEFGSTRYDRFRPFQKTGYFFWPTIKSEESQIEEDVTDVLDRLIRETFDG